MNEIAWNSAIVGQEISTDSKKNTTLGDLDERRWKTIEIQKTTNFLGLL